MSYIDIIHEILNTLSILVNYFLTIAIIKFNYLAVSLLSPLSSLFRLGFPELLWSPFFTILLLASIRLRTLFTIGKKAFNWNCLLKNITGRE